MNRLVKPIMDGWLCVRHSAQNLITDVRGIAATEFAIVVPVMLVLFFGTEEFASGIAVDRKVTLIARTLSDLTSQSAAQALTEARFRNAFNILEGFEGELDDLNQRGNHAGWRFHRLPWVQD